MEYIFLKYIFLVFTNIFIITFFELNYQNYIYILTLNLIYIFLVKINKYKNEFSHLMLIVSIFYYLLSFIITILAIKFLSIKYYILLLSLITTIFVMYFIINKSYNENDIKENELYNSRLDRFNKLKYEFKKLEEKYKENKEVKKFIRILNSMPLSENEELEDIDNSILSVLYTINNESDLDLNIKIINDLLSKRERILK